MEWSVNMSSLGNIRSIIPKVLYMLRISFHQFLFWKPDKIARDGGNLGKWDGWDKGRVDMGAGKYIS